MSAARWRFILRSPAAVPYAPSIVTPYWASTYCFTPCGTVGLIVRRR